MKKRIIIISCILLPLITVALLFASHAKKIAYDAIDEAIQENVNATVVWDKEDLSLSFVSDFPNVSVSLSEIGVINNAPFENEVLFYADALDVSIDIFSILGDKPRITGISLVSPIINILVDPDGQANYDITHPSTKNEDNVETDESFSLSIDHWEIENGTIIYRDQVSNVEMELLNIQHSGSGDFASEKVMTSLDVKADSVFIIYEGVEYLANKTIDADLDISIENDYRKFTLNQNRIRINDLEIIVNGSAEILPKDEYSVKMNVSTGNNQFSDLLSLVPGIYTESFGNIDARGTFDFTLELDGILSSEKIPAFQSRLVTYGASFRYPDKPLGMDEVNVDVTMENSSGKIEETRIDIANMGIRIGQNSLSGNLIIEDMINYSMDGALAGSLNLEDLTRAYPMDNYELKGTTSLDLEINGYYDSAANRMPSIKGEWTLQEGYFKETAAGYAIQDVRLDAKIENQSGEFQDFQFVLNNLSFWLGGQQLLANGLISNIENPSWNINATGALDLEKLVTMLHLEEYGLTSGAVELDIHSQGTLNDLDAGNYTSLPTSGKVFIEQLAYKDPIFTDPIHVDNAEIAFDPRSLTLAKTSMQVGESDLYLEGTVNNYLNYILENAPVTGTMLVRSKMLDFDQMMSWQVPSDSATSEVEEEFIPVPDNVNLQLSAEVGELRISGLSLKDLNAKANVANEIMEMSLIRFETLGGNVSGSGSYDTREIRPKLNLKMKAQALEMRQMVSSLDFVTAYVPIAPFVSGTLDSEFSLTGLMEPDFGLDLNSISSDALVKCLAASIESTPITSGIAQLSGLNDSDFRTVRDIVMHISILDGKLVVDPFDFKIGPYNSNIFGTNGLDGSIAYELTTYLPATLIGKKLNNFVGQSESDNVPITFGIGGAVTSPEIALLLDDQKDMVAEAVRQKAEGEAEEIAEDLIDQVKDEKTRDLIESILTKEKPDSLKSDSLDSTGTKTEDLKEKALDEVKNFFKKKKKKDANQ